MSDKLRIPDSIEKIILEYDRGLEPFSELKLQGALAKARSELIKPTEEESLGAWAEAISFLLVPAENDWGTHFGPISTERYPDGRQTCTPDMTGATPSFVQHWDQRSKTLKNPILRARYSDLAWDFAPMIAKVRKNPDHARLAIDSYLDSLPIRYRADMYERLPAADRALDLAVQIKDKERARKAKDALLDLHREVMKAMEGNWLFAFDRLMQEKNAEVTDADKAELVADLETVVKICADASDPKKFNPHDAQRAAELLCKHYDRVGHSQESKRLLEVVARSFEHFAGMGNAMLGSALLQTAVDSYRKAGLAEESARVRRLMQQRTSDARAEMTSIGQEIEIKKDDMEAFLKNVIIDNLAGSFVRIAYEFIPRKAQLEKQIKESAKSAPLMAHMSSSIMADDHVVAIVGSVEEDPIGHLVRQASMVFTLSDIWMYQAFKRLRERHQLLPEHFAGWANRQELFGDDLRLLLHGIRAWFDDDYVKTVHVLVPQIEKALRKVVDQIGKPTTKAHKRVKGASVVVNMGDILSDEEVKATLGADVTLYLNALYCDPRAYNLRNEMAHGLLDADELNLSIANWVMHTLLVFGALTDVCAALKKRAGEVPAQAEDAQ